MGIFTTAAFLMKVLGSSQHINIKKQKKNTMKCTEITLCIQKRVVSREQFIFVMYEPAKVLHAFVYLYGINSNLPPFNHTFII